MKLLKFAGLGLCLAALQLAAKESVLLLGGAALLGWLGATLSIGQHLRHME